MELFSFSNLDFWCIGITGILFLLLLFYCLALYRLPLKRCRQQDKGAEQSDASFPPVSVIIYAQDDVERIRRHIPAFLPVLALIMVSLILIRVFSAGWKKTDLTELRMTVALIATAGILLSVLSYECNKSEANGIREWTKEARVLYRSGAYESAVRACKKIDGMDANPDYLFEYGRSLFKTGNYQEARRMFENALHYSGDPMILNLLGQTLWAQEDYSGAEECFRRAAHRLPGRIYPYYLLSKLYADSGYYHPDKLRETARVVLTKEPKVPSVAVGQMREEIKRIMEKENLKKCM